MPLGTKLSTSMVLSKAALKFVKELEEGFLKSPTRGQEKSINELSKVTIPSNFEITATYQVNSKLIKVSYKGDLEASYILILFFFELRTIKNSLSN